MSISSFFIKQNEEMISQNNQYHHRRPYHYWFLFFWMLNRCPACYTIPSPKYHHGLRVALASCFSSYICKCHIYHMFAEPSIYFRYPQWFLKWNKKNLRINNRVIKGKLLIKKINISSAMMQKTVTKCSIAHLQNLLL